MGVPTSPTKPGPSSPINADSCPWAACGPLRVSTRYLDFDAVMRWRTGYMGFDSAPARRLRICASSVVSPLALDQLWRGVMTQLLPYRVGITCLQSGVSLHWSQTRIERLACIHAENREADPATQAEMPVLRAVPASNTVGCILLPRLLRQLPVLGRRLGAPAIAREGAPAFFAAHVRFRCGSSPTHPLSGPRYRMCASTAAGSAGVGTPIGSSRPCPHEGAEFVGERAVPD
jgi:hypothetical protein